MAALSSEIEQKVRAAILGRTEKAPRVADTVDGITRWWLSPQGLDVASEHVELVLRKLAEEGRVTVHVLPDGEVLYSGIVPRAIDTDTQ